jgi:hypothetical protein
MIKLPKIKKKLHSFLTKEEGKISKESLIKTGSLIAAFSLGAAINSQPAEGASGSWNDWEAKCDSNLVGSGKGFTIPGCTSEPPTHDITETSPAPDLGCTASGEVDDEWTGHYNGLLLKTDGSQAEATAGHRHSIIGCHASHASHSSHGSHGQW